MNIAFITTFRHNVGDDFVREGLIHLLKTGFTGSHVRTTTIHKHAPISTRYGFEWVRRRELSAILDLLPLGVTRDRVLECDLLVQSGAPVYWCHRAGPKCADNEWFRPLIRKRYARVRDRVPFVNLAAGSCQPYHSDGGEFYEYPRVLGYIRELHECTQITTVRDRLAKNLLDSLGLEAPIIPCASVFARESVGVEAESPEYVALNFMPLGGHYDLNQGVKARRWEQTFRRFYQVVKKNVRCLLVCHDGKELRAARRIDPEAEIFYSRDYRDYIGMYARAATGILNRVHGAFMIASFGRPAFVVGNDSRSRMVEEIGLRHGYVDDVTDEMLVAELERGMGDGGEYGRRWDAIKREASGRYTEVISRLRGLPVARA
jgi:hypothetical protein